MAKHKMPHLGKALMLLEERYPGFVVIVPRGANQLGIYFHGTPAGAEGMVNAARMFDFQKAANEKLKLDEDDEDLSP